MNQHGSLNAVLANEHSAIAHSPKSVPESPPLSPASTTPSFSWPRRVRSPEPHVPLRKASPERLHNRKASSERLNNRKASSEALGNRKASLEGQSNRKASAEGAGSRRAPPPHPLLITTQAGAQGYAPGSSGKSSATPFHSNVHATSERDGIRAHAQGHAHAQAQPHAQPYARSHPSAQNHAHGQPSPRPNPQANGQPNLRQSPHAHAGHVGGPQDRHPAGAHNSPSRQQQHHHHHHQLQQSPQHPLHQHPPHHLMPHHQHALPPPTSDPRPQRQMADPVVGVQRNVSWPLAMDEDYQQNEINQQHHHHHSPYGNTHSDQDESHDQSQNDNQNQRQNQKQSQYANYSHSHTTHHNPHSTEHNTQQRDQRGQHSQHGHRIRTPSPHAQRKYPQPLKTSFSQDSLRRGGPDRLYSTSTNTSTESTERLSPTLRHVPSLQEEEEEIRASFRSALTSNSSAMDSSIGTARSSVATDNSSFSSEYVKLDRVATPEISPYRESMYRRSYHGGSVRGSAAYSDFDVDDALDMYAAGFETPPIKDSLDIPARRESCPRNSIDSIRSAFRPGPSPLALHHREGSNNSHRRSRSASHIFFGRLASSENVKDGLPLPKPAVTGEAGAEASAEAARTSAPAPATAAKAVPRPPSSHAPPPRDRYGFKKISHHISAEVFDTWEKTYSEHLDRRRVKWMALMKQYGFSTDNPIRFPGRSEKVKRYIRKGIPPDWRGAAWFFYAGGPNKLARDPGLYRNTIKRVNNGELTDNDREHIERDLHRTFPDNIRFKPDPGTAARDSHADSGKEDNSSSSNKNEDLETDMIRALRRVLQAFAVHNPNIGYCQSLNFIAGLLLIFLDADEEKTFVLLNVVTTEHLPGTHGVALEGANIDIAVLMTSIRENIPSVWQKLDDRPPAGSIADGPPRLPTVSLATTAWFMSLFVGTLPIECVLRVWDCLFFEGSKTLFRVALAIFKAGEAQIRAVGDPMEVFQVVQSMPRSMIDANALMECCFRKRGGFGGLSQDFVEKKRSEGRRDVREGRTLTDESTSAMARRLARAKTKGRFRNHRR